VDEVAVFVMLRNASDFDNHFGLSVACGGKRNNTVAELRPLFKFPLHLDSLVILKGNVLASDGPSEQHVLASYLLLRDSLSLGHLAESHLVSHGVVNNMLWDIPGYSDLGSLWHD